MEQRAMVTYDFDVSYYDLHYEIDAERRLFRSTQDIAITNASGRSVDRICFLLHPDLLIDDIVIQDAYGRQLPITAWKFGGTTEIVETAFRVVEVQSTPTVSPGQQLRFHLAYHMRPEAIKDAPRPSDHILALTISAEASYAIGPCTGNNVMFNRNDAAPFRVSIKYPQGNLCCAPGRLISVESEAGHIIETYQSDVPNIPTFSCAAYEKRVRERKGVTIEYYLYPGQTFAEEMAEMTAQLVELYALFFGDPGTDIYRFGTVGERDSERAWGENKGNAIYLTELLTKQYMESREARLTYAGFVAHEVFHNWNLFYVHWSGKLYEWFGEGGANFIAAWACERIFGEEVGALGRAYFASEYSGKRAYEVAETLESVEKTGTAERALMYFYGALVWEQLRHKLGDEALLAGLGDFFGKYGFKEVTYREFLECLQARTDVQVEEYLNQWTKHNARIDLSINSVRIEHRDGLYRTEVDILVESDQDYELFTSMGYRTSLQEKMTIVDVHATRRGIHKITFESDARPVWIQIDPAYRVPQVNLDNGTWRDGPS